VACSNQERDSRAGCRPAPSAPIVTQAGTASCAPPWEPRFRWRTDGAPRLIHELLCGAGGVPSRKRWDLYWTDNLEPGTLRLLDGQRRLSRIYGMECLVRKHLLAMTLARAAELAKQRGQPGVFDIAPRSFVFPGEFESWRAAAAARPDTIWISKTGIGARGEGVSMVTNVDAVTPEPDLVLQQYVANPHLLDGFKYTLRVFVAVTSIDPLPLRAWVFPDGLTKLTTRPFTTDRASLGDRFVHLTNSAVLRKDVGAELARQRMTHAAYRERLRQDGHDDVRLFCEIRTLVAKTLLAAREPIVIRNANEGYCLTGQFMLLGFDVLVDRDLRPWVIEVNSGPSLKTEASATSDFGRRERAIKERVASDLLTLAGVLPEGPVEFEPLFPSPPMFEWLPCYERLRDGDRDDLRALVVAEARRALDRAPRPGVAQAWLPAR
jgi:hypothetical protein